MNPDIIAILILIGIGLVGGYFVAKSASKREKIYGSTASKVSNYVASALLISLAPTVLCNVLFIHPQIINTSVFLNVLLIALVMFGLALVALIPFAVIEKPHLDRLAQQADHGWTREDAEKSGL